jgi:hypothetical protein
MRDQVDDLFQPPDPPDVLRRGCSPAAARAPRVGHAGIERNDLLGLDPVEPAVAEVVDVLQHGAISAQDLAELSLFLVGERRRQVPAAVPDGRLPPLAAAPVLEPMQVIAFPAESRLDDVVQEPKACRRRDLDPPPQRRRCSLQADLQRDTSPAFTAAARSLEAGHAACSAAHDLGLGLGKVDHRGRLGAAVCECGRLPGRGRLSAARIGGRRLIPGLSARR